MKRVWKILIIISVMIILFFISIKIWISTMQCEGIDYCEFTSQNTICSSDDDCILKIISGTCNTEIHECEYEDYSYPREHFPCLGDIPTECDMIMRGRCIISKCEDFRGYGTDEKGCLSAGGKWHGNGGC